MGIYPFSLLCPLILCDDGTDEGYVLNFKSNSFTCFTLHPANSPLLTILSLSPPCQARITLPRRMSKFTRKSNSKGIIYHSILSVHLADKKAPNYTYKLASDSFTCQFG